MMIRFKQSKLLVVAPSTSIVPVPANKHVMHIENTNRIFPVINEFQPQGIVLDYDYLGNHTEKVLRRLSSNPFYRNIKVFCYKSTSHTKVDDLLKTLGVKYFVYADREKQTPKPTNTTVKAISEMLEASMIKTLADASY
jgi:hypothetical protein